MGALGLIFRAELRRRGRAWLALAVLVAVVGGVVLAAAAAGQRTADAFPSYLSRYGFDVALYTSKVDLTRFPEVTRATEIVGTDNGQPTCACTHSVGANDFGLIWLPSDQDRISKLVSGRLPDPSRPDEVVASYTMQQDLGLHIGSVVRVPFFSPAQAAAYNNTPTGALRPDGPIVSFRITGFEATEFDFPTGGTANYDLFASAAFARQTLPHIAYGYVYAVNLKHGSADLARFARDTGALGEPSNQDASVGAIESSIHPQAVGWWILALLAALVGVAVVGQALFRQSAVEAVDFPVLGTLGADRALLVALGTARNVVIGVLGGVGALGVATALSPFAPLGEARVAELHTGVAFDGGVLALGALAIVVAVIGLGTAAVMRTASTRPAVPRWPARPSAVVTRVAALGAPPSVVVGVRSALERRSGDGAVPVGTAMLGTVLAVTALVGTAVFGASLAHLDATPRLYGDDAQLNFTNPEPNQTDPTFMRILEHDPDVNDITTGFAAEIQVNGDSVGAIVGTAVRGPLLLSAVSGALPTGPGEISLGRATMRQLHVHVGSHVRVSLPVPTGGVHTTAFTVVSQVTFPVLGGQVSLGNGAALTFAGYAAAVCTPGRAEASCQHDPFAGETAGGVLVNFKPGAPGRADLTRYLHLSTVEAAVPPAPTSLVNFGEAVDFPLLFGAMLALSGAATLVHLLVVSVSRRRRDTWLLKAIGFVKGQVVSATVWQATTIALVGIVIGLPLGIVVGQAVWHAFAANLGVVPVVAFQAWLLAVLVVGVLVVAIFLAVVPALTAARSRPEAFLRTP